MFEQMLQALYENENSTTYKNDNYEICKIKSPSLFLCSHRLSNTFQLKSLTQCTSFHINSHSNLNWKSELFTQVSTVWTHLAHSNACRNTESPNCSHTSQNVHLRRIKRLRRTLWTLNSWSRMWCDERGEPREEK